MFPLLVIIGIVMLAHGNVFGLFVILLGWLLFAEKKR